MTPDDDLILEPDFYMDDCRVPAKSMCPKCQSMNTVVAFGLRHKMVIIFGCRTCRSRWKPRRNTI